MGQSFKFCFLQPALLTMDREKLKKLVLWMVCIALRSKGSDEQTTESLISKLLRWLTASVILAIPSQQSLPDTLQSFLEAERSVNRVASDSDELLAAAIYYLHQILGKKCGVFTSVVSSLCLLLFSDPSLADVLPVEGGTLTSLLSRIRCPTEADRLWRWSFEEPSKDPETDSCSVDEIQACQSVLMVVSKVLGLKSSLSHFDSDLDLEKSGVLQWERSLVEETM